MRTLALALTALLIPSFVPAQVAAPAMATTVPTGNAELGQIQTVYFMQMGNGFDQYLANRLRTVGQIRVVTDPMKADAIFTDKIGTVFEMKLEAIEETAAEKAAERAAAPGPDNLTPAERSAFKLAPRAVSNLSAARGTVFLVDRRSRVVLWSTYEKPKDYTPKVLDKTAGRITEQFARDLTGKK
jgi:hypothetical protein